MRYFVVFLILVQSSFLFAESKTDCAIGYIGCSIPRDKERASEVLWKQFVEGRGYNRHEGIAMNDFRAQYDEKVHKFLQAADTAMLPHLGEVFKTLNYGRNKATNACLPHVVVNWAPKGFSGISAPVDLTGVNDIMIAEGTSKENVKKIRDSVKAENFKRDEYQRAHPEEFEDTSHYELPIAVDRAKLESSDCWVVTCLWEYGEGNNPPRKIGHVIVYCIDDSGREIVSWVRCD